jgi:hypothetical protein
MAYYNYKRVRDLVPNEFVEEFSKVYKEQTGEDYCGESNYDGDMWIMTANYIDYLQTFLPNEHTYSEYFQGRSVF